MKHSFLQSCFKTDENPLGASSQTEPVGFGVLRDECLVEVNSRLCQLSGYSKAELEGQPFRMLFLSDDTYREIFTKLLADLNEKDLASVAAILKRRDGSTLQAVLSLAYSNQPGIAKSIIFTIIDITPGRYRGQQDSQKETLSQIVINAIKNESPGDIAKNWREKQVKKLLAAFEYCPALVVITDRDGVIEYVNQYFKNTTDYSMDELEGTVAKVFQPWCTSDDEHQKMLEALKRGETWSCEFLNQKKSGEKFWEAVNISSLRDSNGDITSYVLVSEDVSRFNVIENELIAAKQAAEENDKLKTSFLNNLSHEVRTPLNAIMGFSEFIKDENLTQDKKRAYSDAIMKSSSYLLALLENIITMSIIEAGQVRINSSVVSLNELLNDVYSQVSVAFARDDVELLIKPEMNLEHDLVLMDQTKVMQILINLVGNALKFTLNGYVNFGCELDGDSLLFTVEDSGVGFPIEMKDTLFERFTQGNNSPTGLQEGMGLGLAITKSYVDLMGGTIDLQSEVGKGTKFSVKIPYNPAFEQEIIKQELPPPIIKGNKTILVADDVELNHMLITVMLSGYNLKVLYSRNGKEAMEMVILNPEISLVLMDIEMPVMDGLAATRLIKQARPEVVVIAQTAHVFDGNKQEAAMAGCDGYMVKPINREELVKLLANYL